MKNDRVKPPCSCSSLGNAERGGCKVQMTRPWKCLIRRGLGWVFGWLVGWLVVCLFVKKVFCCPTDNNSRRAPICTSVGLSITSHATVRSRVYLKWVSYLNMFRLPFSELPHERRKTKKGQVYREKCTTHVPVWSELSKSLLFGCVDRIPRVPGAQAVMENLKQSWFGWRWISISKVAHEALHFRMLESRYEKNASRFKENCHFGG